MYFFNLSNDRSWDLHINNSIEKAWKRLNIMRCLKICLDRKSLQVIYFTFVRPIIEYGDVVWDNILQYLKNDLDKIQTEAARTVTDCSKLVSLDEQKYECGWESLGDRRRKH